ncbi:MAG: hypothetical protein ACREFD_06080 [Stellaceae bacterium]
MPERIRVAHDRLGREHHYDDMRRRLDTTIGPGRCWFAGERLPPLPDTLLFDFIAVADAQAFVDRMGRWRMAASSRGRQPTSLTMVPGRDDEKSHMRPPSKEKIDQCRGFGASDADAVIALRLNE